MADIRRAAPNITPVSFDPTPAATAAGPSTFSGVANALGDTFDTLIKIEDRKNEKIRLDAFVKEQNRLDSSRQMRNAFELEMLDATNSSLGTSPAGIPATVDELKDLSGAQRTARLLDIKATNTNSALIQTQRLAKYNEFITRNPQFAGEASDWFKQVSGKGVLEASAELAALKDKDVLDQKKNLEEQIQNFRKEHDISPQLMDDHELLSYMDVSANAKFELQKTAEQQARATLLSTNLTNKQKIKEDWFNTDSGNLNIQFTALANNLLNQIKGGNPELANNPSVAIAAIDQGYSQLISQTAAKYGIAPGDVETKMPQLQQMRTDLINIVKGGPEADLAANTLKAWQDTAVFSASNKEGFKDIWGRMSAVHSVLQNIDLEANQRIALMRFVAPVISTLQDGNNPKVSDFEAINKATGKTIGNDTGTLLAKAAVNGVKFVTADNIPEGYQNIVNSLDKYLQYIDTENIKTGTLSKEFYDNLMILSQNKNVLDKVKFNPTIVANIRTALQTHLDALSSNAYIELQKYAGQADVLTSIGDKRGPKYDIGIDVEKVAPSGMFSSKNDLETIGLKWWGSLGLSQIQQRSASTISTVSVDEAGNVTIAPRESSWLHEMGMSDFQANRWTSVVNNINKKLGPTLSNLVKSYSSIYDIPDKQKAFASMMADGFGASNSVPGSSRDFSFWKREVLSHPQADSLTPEQVDDIALKLSEGK